MHKTLIFPRQKHVRAGGALCVEEQQTRNWQNFTDHHESAHQND